MKFEVHKAAAEEYFKVAEPFDKRYAVEKDEIKKISLRIVAAQNYFYSAVNAIEAVFDRKLTLHSFSHENRMRNMLDHRNIFSKEIIELYELVDRNQRNKVTYRGENGRKYANIKKLAKLLILSI